MCPFLAPAHRSRPPELSIFSRHYRTEICSIDVETGRIDRFGEGSSYPSRAILLYSGIHYDATSFAPMPGAPLDFHETLFPEGNRNILMAAQLLAGKLREQKKFTNTATFLLKCEARVLLFVRPQGKVYSSAQICGKGLKGEKEATLHASETGHAQFGEYD